MFAQIQIAIKFLFLLIRTTISFWFYSHTHLITFDLHQQPSRSSWDSLDRSTEDYAIRLCVRLILVAALHRRSINMYVCCACALCYILIPRKRTTRNGLHTAIALQRLLQFGFFVFFSSLYSAHSIAHTQHIAKRWRRAATSVLTCFVHQQNGRRAYLCDIYSIVA